MVGASQLSDDELLRETSRVVEQERRTTAKLIALLAELDARRLYLGAGYSSLFTYCTKELGLSESAAYSRITAARAGRRFPLLFTLLADGGVTLTTVSLLAGHLTDDNHEALLADARHKSRRDVEQIVAGLCAQPDVRAAVRRLPSVSQSAPARPLMALPDQPTETPTLPGESASTQLATPTAEARSIRIRTAVAPLSADRYLLRVTLTAEGRRHLDRARDLMRHSIPSADPASIVEKALALLVGHLERTKLSATARPQKIRRDVASNTGRRIPAAVKRDVWARDSGTCAFRGERGRCTETGFLEFHHVVPFAAGGASAPDNLELRCRAHNQYEAERYFGHRTTTDPQRPHDG